MSAPPAAAPKGPNYKVLVLGLALILPLVGVLYTGFGRDPRDRDDKQLEHHNAPNFELAVFPSKKFQEGGKVRLSDALKQGPVVINFWATWCMPCRSEQPILLEAARRYEPKGIQFFGSVYSEEDDEAAIRAYLKENGEWYRTLIDPGGRVAVDYGVGGVPETFFIQPDGTIMYKHTGPIRWDDMVAALEGLLR